MWVEAGDRKEEWCDPLADHHGTLGWKWRHESPTPEPEDLSAINYLSDLELTPSEAAALDAVRPPTPASPRALDDQPAGVDHFDYTPVFKRQKEAQSVAEPLRRQPGKRIEVAKRNKAEADMAAETPPIDTRSR